MSCQILVSNTCSVDRSEIIAIFNGDHIWGSCETMRSWISSGKLKEDWKRPFSLVIVTDKTNQELSYLLEQLQTGLNKYHFSEPNPEETLYIELYNEGQVTAPFSVVSQYLVERS